MKGSEIMSNSLKDDCHQQELVSPGIGGKGRFLKGKVCSMLVFEVAMCKA